MHACMHAIVILVCLAEIARGDCAHQEWTAKWERYVERQTEQLRTRLRIGRGIEIYFWGVLTVRCLSAHLVRGSQCVL
jgi:hypothetical protein